MLEEEEEEEEPKLTSSSSTPKPFFPIPQHADLLESSHMPALLLQLVAHVSANRVVLSRWAQGENAATSAIAYPDSLHSWASSQFRGIKARQALLLGVKGSLSGESDEDEGEYDFEGDDDEGEREVEKGGSRGGEMEEGAWAEPLVAVSSKL